mmetsp:Transcript_3026/g.5354  ORF Transcript_3026/g.5354 Transcript_3026/m.5354 type:complete len:175 (-) Transcript_3026:205-729(-)
MKDNRFSTVYDIRDVVEDGYETSMGLSTEAHFDEMLQLSVLLFFILVCIGWPILMRRTKRRSRLSLSNAAALQSSLSPQSPRTEINVARMDEIILAGVDSSSKHFKYDSSDIEIGYMSEVTPAATQSSTPVEPRSPEVPDQFSTIVFHERPLCLNTQQSVQSSLFGKGFSFLRV